MRLIWPRLRIVAGIAAIAYAFVLLSGCAVGRGNGGEIVAGFQIGQPLPDSAAEALTGAGSLIGGIFGGPVGASIGGTLVAGVLGLTGLAVKKSGDAKAERAASLAHDEAWDESAREAERKRAELDAAYLEGRALAASAPANQPGAAA